MSDEKLDGSLAIETHRLTKVFGHGNTEVVAMRDASMQVRRGEVVALLGPSGSGKSTFLTAVGLINPPTSGQVFIGGKLVLDGPQARANLRAFRRRHIGFVFHSEKSAAAVLDSCRIFAMMSWRHVSALPALTSILVIS